MKTNITARLRASIFALSAASLAVTAPAIADENKANQWQDKGDTAKFSQLDQNNDQRLNQNELEKFAENKPIDAEQALSRFDRDNDNALSEREYQQLTSNMQLDNQRRDTASASSERSENKPDGAQVVVDQKPTQITVDKPAAQVTVDQPKPKVRITTQDPEVEVEQAEPRVSVQQGEPDVSVDQARPNVEVRDAEPDVQVSRSEPQVDVNEQEPEVSIESAEERDTQNNQMISQEQQSMQQERITARDEQPQQGQLSQQAQNEDLYTRSVSELRSAEVVDQQGETLGNIEEVVIKRDASEAGFIISTTGSDGGEMRHIYRAADDFSVDGDQLVFTENAQTLTEPQGFMSQEFMAAPGDDSTLRELVNHEGLSAR